MLNFLRLEEFLFLFVCVSASVHMSLNTWRLEETLRCWALPSTLFEQGFLFAVSYVRLAGLQASRYSLLSTSHLAEGMFRLQACAILHSCVWVLDIGIQILMFVWQVLLLTKPLPHPRKVLAESPYYCLLSFLPVARLVTGSTVKIVRSPLLWKFSNH